MDIHEDHKPTIGEKIIRFLFGGVLGGIVGLFIVSRFDLLEFDIVFFVVLSALLLCAFIALKFGNALWRTIFHR
jgi:hypothetical protein